MKTKKAKDSMNVKMNKIYRMVKAKGAIHLSEIFKEFNISMVTWYNWRKHLKIMYGDRLRFNPTLSILSLPPEEMAKTIPDVNEEEAQ